MPGYLKVIAINRNFLAANQFHRAFAFIPLLHNIKHTTTESSENEYVRFVIGSDKNRDFFRAPSVFLSNY